MNANQPTTLAKTDYAANGGTYVRDPITGANPMLSDGPDIACETTYFERDYLKTPSCCNWSHTNAWLKANFNGISGERSEIQDNDVFDGTSNTMLAGEKCLDPAFYRTGTDDGDNNSMYQGNDSDVVRWTTDVPLQDTFGIVASSSRFGGPHSGAFFAAFCDGSVRSIDFTVDTTVYAQFGNRRDSRP